MHFEFTPRFEKRFDALRNGDLRVRLRDVVRKVGNATTLSDIPNLKKMEGHPSAYRIRVGNLE